MHAPDTILQSARKTLNYVERSHSWLSICSVASVGGLGRGPRALLLVSVSAFQLYAIALYYDSPMSSFYRNCVIACALIPFRMIVKKVVLCFAKCDDKANGVVRGFTWHKARLLSSAAALISLFFLNSIPRPRKRNRNLCGIVSLGRRSQSRSPRRAAAE